MNATVVVSMTLEQLRTGLGAAGLTTGESISAGEARRLACRAGIIPAVLGGPSQVLDLGRRRRFHSGAQRIALDLEYGGCTTEGCDRPAGWCEAHHEVGWSSGGGTSVRDGRLLCPRHHHLTTRGSTSRGWPTAGSASTGGRDSLSGCRTSTRTATTSRCSAHTAGGQRRTRPATCCR